MGGLRDDIERGLAWDARDPMMLSRSHDMDETEYDLR